MAGPDAVEERLLGELIGAGLDHHHRLFGADDDQIEVGDSVVARYLEALTLELKKTKVAAGEPTVSEELGRAKPGERPAVAGQRTITAITDVVAVDLSTLNATPCYDPVSHLVHAVGREAVTDVWVAGHRVVDSRTLTMADEAEILARARSWQERLQ